MESGDSGLTRVLQLLLEIRRELQDLRRDVSEIRGLLVDLLRNEEPTLDSIISAQRVAFPEIPEEVVAKFMNSLSSNSPETFQDVSDMPLEEGFDALVYHFAQSTVLSDPGFDPSQRKPKETQFVNLLKSKWILDNMEHSSYLTAADFIVNTDITRVIPAYAAPGGATGSHNLLLSNRHVQDLRSNVSWSINGSPKPEKTGKAMLQMWQPQSLSVCTEAPDAVPLSPTQSDLSVASPRSFSGSWQSFVGSNNPSRHSTALSTSTTLLSGSSATSVMLGSRGKGTAIKTPEPPVIVFFSMYDGKYAFLHFELTDRVFVNPEKCHCRQNSKRPCCTVVIDTKDKTIDLRRFYASQEAGKGLYTWDLARFRIPKHPQHKDVEVVKKVEYLTLEFDSVEEKDVFREELRSLETVRNLDIQTCSGIIAAARSRDHRPAKR
ncbi:MAG: hypothetical protein Q9172_004931 [Xanthocarpia lactea]